MINIMKSIWYEIIRSKLLINIYLLFVVIMGLIAVLNINTGEKAGASGMITSSPEITYEFPIFILALFVGVICGSDYKDKVGNYEILSGHSRISIFLARSLMGIFVGAVFSTLLCFIPIIAGTIIGGWGNAVAMNDVIIRHAAFFALLTFLIKNQYIMMAFGWVVSMSPTILNGMLAKGNNVYISIFNMGLLNSYDGWKIYNVDPVDGIVNYNSYISTVTSGMVIGTVAASLLMVGFYLFMGYALFRRDELN